MNTNILTNQRPYQAVSFFERDHSWTFFSVALFLRLAIFFFILFQFGDGGFISPPFSDSHEYVTIAKNLLAGHGFSLGEETPFLPDAKRMPMYPLFLAATFSLTGGALWLAALLQTFVSSAIVLFVYRVGKTLAGGRAAFFGAAFATIQPFTIFLSTQILTETFFTAFLFGSFVLFIHALTSGKYLHFLAGGIIAGIATLTKPAAQYVPFLLAPIIALGQHGKKRVWNSLIFLVGFLIVISPWVIRNNAAVGIPTVSHEANILFSLHIAGYQAFKATGVANVSSADKYRDDQETMYSTPRSEYVGRVLKIFVSDPVVFSHYLLLTTVPFVFGDGFVTIVQSLSSNSGLPPWDFSTSASALGRTIGFGVLPPWLIIASILSKSLWGIVLLSAVFGFVQFLRGGRQKIFIGVAIALTVCYFMVAGSYVNSARYRQPVEPVIFLLAGAGLSKLWEIWEHRRKIIPSSKQATL